MVKDTWYSWKGGKDLTSVTSLQENDVLPWKIREKFSILIPHCRLLDTEKGVQLPQPDIPPVTVSWDLCSNLELTLPRIRTFLNLPNSKNNAVLCLPDAVCLIFTYPILPN